MQFPFNWMALGIVRGALRESCVVHVEDKVLPEVCAVDAWVEPREGRLPRDDDDWLTRMGYEPCEIEPFHAGPTLAEHNDSIMKLMALHARERKRAAGEGRPAPPTPRLWFACAKHPRELIARWAMEPMAKGGWPRGFYASVAPAGPCAVSLRELPRERSTLLLRMMASGKTFVEAVEELLALPEGARERRIAGPLLVQLQGDLPRMGVTLTWTTPEEHETMISYEEAQRIWDKREADAIATKQAMAETQRAMAESQRAMAESQRAMVEALRGAQRQFERRLGRPLTDAEREAVAARFRSPGPERVFDVVLDLDATALAAWLADPDAR